MSSPAGSRGQGTSVRYKCDSISQETVVGSWSLGSLGATLLGQPPPLVSLAHLPPSLLLG